ncbi:Uncharacterised protein [Mycobacteroides abscessus subsp. abscessus]|nr:Uncharacterised protein [Mycobacteroides abscessus subsp. abscessus]
MGKGTRGRDAPKCCHASSAPPAHKRPAAAKATVALSPVRSPSIETTSDAGVFAATMPRRV